MSFGSPTLTAAVTETLVRLNAMIGEQAATKTMIAKAMKYLGTKVVEDVERAKKWRKEGTPYSINWDNAVHYLYISALSGWRQTSAEAAATDYVLDEVKKNNTGLNLYYKAIMAAVNFVKARRYGDPIVQSLRNINIADAGISIVSLTVMMIAVFGDGDADDPSMKAVKAFVGFGAVAIVTAMSLIMVIKAVKRLRIKEADRHELRKDECDIREEK